MGRLTYKDNDGYKLLRGREYQWKKKIKEYETIDNSIQKLGKIEDLLENYDIENLSGLNEKLTLLQILCEHPTFSIADLENLVDDYDEGKINKDFDLYEYKFLYKYFGRNWGEPPYYPELDDEED